MYIVLLLISFIFILVSLPFLRKDMNVIKTYKEQINASKKELEELKELKYHLVNEIEDAITQSDLDALSLEILKLAEQGYDVKEIAKRLDKGVGEVQIMLRVGQMRMQNERT